MSKDKISQYSSTSAGANLNTDIAGINIDEGCPPSGINNAIRALMSQVKDLQSGVSGDTIPIAAGGTGEASAASARAALGVAINSDVMKYVAPGSSGNLLVSTGADWTSSASAAVVSSVTAGAGISVSANTGNVTITNTGVTDITAGAGISLSANTGSITISAAGGGGFANMEVFTSSGTWTNPGNITKVKVTVVGGGGGFTEVNDSAGNNRAGTGGTSSFGTYCSATGGQGAFGWATNPGAKGFGAGAGGVGSGGNLNLQGGAGGCVTGPISVASVTRAANGGGSMMGQGSYISIAGSAPQGTPALIQGTGTYGGGGISSHGDYGFGGAGGGGTAIEVIPFPTATNVPVTVGAAGTPYTGSPQNNDYQQNGVAGVVIVEY